MTDEEAIELANQLGWILNEEDPAQELVDQIVRKGYNIWVESPSADFVVVDQNRKEIARIS